MDKRGKRYLRERIQRGIALLDRKAPGWDETVEARNLDLGSPTRCVVGQAADHIMEVLRGAAHRPHGTQRYEYGTGVEALGLNSRASTVSHGFEVTNARRHDYDYHDMTEAWCEALADRRTLRQLEASLGNQRASEPVVVGRGAW